jgi:hypothetical protein
MNPPAARRRRRALRRFARRAVVGFISLALCFGVVVDQTNAVGLVLYGPPQREFISPYPSSWFATTSFSVSRRLNSVFRGLRKLWSSGSAASVSGAAGGAPKPWQAADPAGPFSVVNLANGNLFTAVPIVSWEGVVFALFHNSAVNAGIAELGSGWSHSYSAHLIHDGVTIPPTMTLHDDDGTEIAFVLTGSVWENKVFRLKIEVSGEGWRLRDAQQNVRLFDEEGLFPSRIPAATQPS